MQVVFKTAQGHKLYQQDGKFYTSHPMEVAKALMEDAESDNLIDAAMAISLAREITEAGELKPICHYVWLNFTSSTGSCDSRLIGNGCFPLETAIAAIKAFTLEELLAAAPTWLKDITTIKLSAQNIELDGKVMFLREINIQKPCTRQIFLTRQLVVLVLSTPTYLVCIKCLKQLMKLSMLYIRIYVKCMFNQIILIFLVNYLRMSMICAILVGLNVLIYLDQ